MLDETPPAAPTAAQDSDQPGQPAPVSGTPALDAPTESASLKITLGPNTVEAQGTVLLICTIGILGAVATAYIAATRASGHGLALFLTLAAAELMLTATVIFRITRRGRVARQRKAALSQVSNLPVGQSTASDAQQDTHKDTQEEQPSQLPGSTG